MKDAHFSSLHCVSRAHNIEIRQSSLSQLSLNPLHGILSINFSWLHWAERLDVSFFRVYVFEKLFSLSNFSRISPANLICALY